MIALMLRAGILALLAVLMPQVVSGQATVVLRIRVVLLDSQQTPTPVPRHALLITELPVSAPPRRVLTGLDGNVELKVRPGSYTVESDRPVTFFGKAYQWTQMVEVAAGRDTTLELTASNADVEPAAAAAPVPGGAAAAPGAAPENDPAFLQVQWQDSVVRVWTATTHGSGFVIDSTGLIATNRRGIGNAASAEVQISPSTKVAATVLATDAARDVAILAIDPGAVASVRPVPLGCDQTAKARVVDGQELFAIGISLRQQKRMTSGTVRRSDAQTIVSDIFLARGSAGGPVFTAAGAVVGITSAGDAADESRRADLPVVRVEVVCALLASAEKKMKSVAPPGAAPLPVEPTRPIPVDAMKAAVERRAGALSPYQITSSAFDVAFITPVLLYGAQYQDQQVSRSGRNTGRPPDIQPPLVRPLLDFSNWSDYVVDYPPVLLVRVTPKLVEGFWTTIARGAARTQGIAVPPIKHFTSGFSRLRAFCGSQEVTPIHPFKLEQRLSETEAIYEGLYVFDPAALGPECGTVKLELYSEKEPGKPDTRTVDPKLIQQIWDDFAPYRALPR